MTKARKILCFSLAAVLAFSMIGCKNQTKSTDDSKLDPVKLTWYYVGNGQTAGTDAVNTALSTYLKDKLNVSLTLTQFDWGSYDTKMTTMAAASSPFDIAFTCGWAFNYFTNAKKSAFYELTADRLSKYAPDVTKVIGQNVLDGSKVGGKLYALPVNKEKAHDFGILFNKALVDKYSFDITKVKTLDDLTPMLKTIKEKEPGIYGLASNQKGSAVMQLACPFETLSGVENVPGAVYTNNDESNTKVFNQYDTPEFKAYLKLMRSWFQAGYIRQDAATIKSDSTVDNGQVFANPSQMLPGKDVSMSNDKVTWVQQEITPIQTSNIDMCGSMNAVSASSQNPERALKLLNLVYSDKTLMNMIVYGIENTNYTKTADNIVTVAKDDTFANASYAWEFGNNFLVYPTKSDDPNKWSKIEDFNKKATTLNSTGFQFDTTDVTSQLSAINSVLGEYMPMLCTGSVDPDTNLPKFLSALKDAGSDTVIAKIQSQYTDFLKNKKK